MYIALSKSKAPRQRHAIAGLSVSVLRRNEAVAGLCSDDMGFTLRDLFPWCCRAWWGFDVVGQPCLLIC